MNRENLKQVIIDQKEIYLNNPLVKRDFEPEEKINYATETNQKDNEGNLVITSDRVVILCKNQNQELAIGTISAANATTNTVMAITAEEKKYYIFMPENQMKYALSVLKWAAKITQENPGVQK